MSPTQKKKAARIKAKPAKSTASNSKQSQATPKPAAAQAQIDVMIWLHAKKGKEAPLGRELKTLANASRAESGCLAFALHPSAAQPEDFFLHEIWFNEAALAAHRQTPHFQRWLGLQGAILESRRRFIAE